MPFRLGDDGVPVTVPQDSPEEIGAAVLNVLVCPQGAKLADPGFGIPELLFQNVPLNLTGVLEAVRRLEPRADLSATQALSDVQRTVQAITGQRLPGTSLPGLTFPSKGESVTVIEGGPGSVDVAVTAQVPGGAQQPESRPVPKDASPDDLLFPSNSLIP